VFERKVTWMIYGLVINQGGSWRIRTYEEIDLPIRHAFIVRFIKVQRIGWIGHIVRMDKERTAKRRTEWRPITLRKIGRLPYNEYRVSPGGSKRPGRDADPSLHSSAEV
jgi:hypothetical protein